MLTELQAPVDYRLPMGDGLVAMNALLGQPLQLIYQGAIFCIHCGRKTKKSFSQGYCYPCFQRLARCDSCIVSPEKCHYDEGTCREPEWGEENCLRDHFVYLANSSGVKAGITRGNQIPTRWMDQGAIQAVPILRVATRYLSGLVEVVLKNHVADKTNWRAMLKGSVDELDMAAVRDELLATIKSDIEALQGEHGIQALTVLDDEATVAIEYPVLEYPTKVVSFNFDKQAVVSGVLKGIKGQYLILDTGVINMRKFAGYDVSLQAQE